GVAAAAMKSGRGPSTAKKTTAATSRAGSSAPASVAASDGPAARASRARALMRSSVSISGLPEAGGDGRQPAMAGDAHGALAHVQRAGGVGDRAALDRDRGDDRLLRRRQRLDRPADVAAAGAFRLRLGQRLGKRLNVDLLNPPRAPEGVDHLEARD